MLQTFLGNLWTMTLIIICITVIFICVAITYSVIKAIIEIIKEDKIKNEIHNTNKKN